MDYGYLERWLEVKFHYSMQLPSLFIFVIQGGSCLMKVVIIRDLKFIDYVRLEEWSLLEVSYTKKSILAKYDV